MIIDRIEVTAPFKYLWLKRVNGYDLSKHCARCLLGEYSDQVSPSTTIASDIKLENGIWYLCGVSQPFVWNRNFHLAFMYCEGHTVSYSLNGITLTISDAIALPISQGFIDPSLPQSQKKEYFSCRNWQFANWLRQNAQLLAPQPQRLEVHSGPQETAS